jgi:hypothetical protein
VFLVQEDSELLSYRFAVRRGGLLEQTVLDILREIAPDPGDSMSQGAIKLLMSVARAAHFNLR